MGRWSRLESVSHIKSTSIRCDAVANGYRGLPQRRRRAFLEIPQLYFGVCSGFGKQSSPASFSRLLRGTPVRMEAAGGKLYVAFVIVLCCRLVAFLPHAIVGKASAAPVQYITFGAREYRFRVPTVHQGIYGHVASYLFEIRIGLTDNVVQGRTYFRFGRKLGFIRTMRTGAGEQKKDSCTYCFDPESRGSSVGRGHEITRTLVMWIPVARCVGGRPGTNGVL